MPAWLGVAGVAGGLGDHVHGGLGAQVVGQQTAHQRAGALAARWQCTCRNLAIEHGLDDVIAIEEAVYGKGEGGAVTIAFSIEPS